MIRVWMSQELLDDAATWTDWELVDGVEYATEDEAREAHRDDHGLIFAFTQGDTPEDAAAPVRLTPTEQDAAWDAETAFMEPRADGS